MRLPRGHGEEKVRLPSTWWLHKDAEMASGEIKRGTQITCHLKEAMSTGEDSANPIEFLEVRMCHDQQLRSKNLIAERESETAHLRICTFFSFPLSV